ncbi:helix-turn-helix domain-containing protein [Aquamicrobium sp. LC103]|uniref:helix-turn-helix domain-containing protein n=1 Tax=Aquamicrobium sp. LC103 TaxID=1120658 RepID=UPI0006997DAF|nr:helix-turn-helix domain-containing protein [Aquamicrobium sp. LC103]TKT77435.1 helix-turn-helix domain-containing protein [Aquamicrobium sp. LC103]
MQVSHLSVLAYADAVVPNFAPSEWRLDSARYGGHSHVLALSEGRGAVTLSKGQLRLEAPAFCWMPAGAAQSLRLEPGSGGYVLSFSENLVSLSIGRSGNSAALRTTADRLVHAARTGGGVGMNALAMAAETIHREVREPRENGAELLAACVTIILVNAQRLSDYHPLSQGNDRTAPQLLQRFLQAVEIHFREQFPIRRYASELGVTERRLHDTVVKSTGRSPLALVHARMLEEARTRVEESALPIAQIGYGLGFRDPAHFTRFFRKATGVSPRTHRMQARDSRRERESFASWP